MYAVKKNNQQLLIAPNPALHQKYKTLLLNIHFIVKPATLHFSVYSTTLQTTGTAVQGHLSTQAVVSLVERRGLLTESTAASNECSALVQCRVQWVNSLSPVAP